MSYLICLYVYYHGNNLLAFGLDPGKASLGELNTGLQRTGTAKDYEGLLPDDVVAAMKKAEAEALENDYERLLRDAIAESQSLTKQLIDSSLNVDVGNVKSEDFDRADDTGSIEMGFFDELNGLGDYRRNDVWNPW